VEQYRRIIEKIHRRGILIFGNFILGFDEDRQSVFQELIDFIQETSIECPLIYLLIPFPGSAVYRQFETEGRLFHKNWNFYDDTSPCVVFRPKQLTPEELTEGYLNVVKSVHNVAGYFRRTLSARTHLKSTIFGFHIGNEQRKTVLAGMEKSKKALEFHDDGCSISPGKSLTMPSE
jgi:hypothetical protein